MTEDEYQENVRQLWGEAEQRADVAVDYLITQPPLRRARYELYRLLDWALTAGAENAEFVLERMRRRKLSQREIQ